MAVRSGRFSGLRGAFLDMLAEDPPQAGIDKFFHDDLLNLSHDDLHEERLRLQARLRFTPRPERVHWPAVWFSQRLERVEGELRGHHGRR